MEAQATPTPWPKPSLWHSYGKLDWKNGLQVLEPNIEAQRKIVAAGSQSLR